MAGVSLAIVHKPLKFAGSHLYALCPHTMYMFSGIKTTVLLNNLVINLASKAPSASFIPSFWPSVVLLVIPVIRSLLVRRVQARSPLAPAYIPMHCTRLSGLESLQPDLLWGLKTIPWVCTCRQ